VQGRRLPRNRNVELPLSSCELKSPLISACILV
jgi:hypothetical protein